MNWISLGVMVGCIVYLAVIILNFLEKYRENKDRIEQTLIDIHRLEDQLKESEQARTGAESRTAQLEEEGLSLEQQVSELHQKINAAIPTAGNAAPPQSASPGA